MKLPCFWALWLCLANVLAVEGGDYSTGGALCAQTRNDLRVDCTCEASRDTVLIDGVREIAEHYDVFILDMCGVIHDQLTPFEGAVETVKMLQQMGKTVLIMGNAPITRTMVGERIRKFDIELEPEYLWASGEIFLREMQKGKVPGWREGLRIFYTGRDAFWAALADTSPTTLRVYDIKQADMMILLGDTQIGESEDFMDVFLLEAAAYQVPMLCVNPDLWAIKGPDAIVYTPGTWAKRYARMGGEVLAFYGKPHPTIYDYALEHLSEQGFGDRERIIMVGDTMYTDIEGAARAGIHSLWILHGSHRDRVLNAFGAADLEGMQDVMREYARVPNWAAKAFRW